MLNRFHFSVTCFQDDTSVDSEDPNDLMIRCQCMTDTPNDSFKTKQPVSLVVAQDRFVEECVKTDSKPSKLLKFSPSRKRLGLDVFLELISRCTSLRDIQFEIL